MHADVIYKFVFGFERLPFSGAVLPVANVVRLLRPPHMLHGQMGDELVHRAESFVARLFGVRQLLRFDPLTDELLLDRLPHVSEEGPGSVVRGHIHVHGAVAVELSGGVVVGSRARNVAVLVGSPVHVPREAQPHLAVDHVGRRVARRLLVQPGEEQVPRRIGVSMWPCETPGGEQAVLRPGGIPETPISEKKVPGGVESRRGVRANVGRVVVVSQSGCRVAGRLGGKGSLSGADVVGAVVDFEGAHPVREGVYPQRHFSLRDFAC